MKVIINVGRPKTGKTTRAKKILQSFVADFRKNDLIVYDVNNEYRDFYNESFLPYDEFIKKLVGVKNKILLFEEATIFFSSRSEEKIIKELMVRKRHDNNIIILNFHSIRSIPRYIFDLADYIILFKTNDTLKVVKDKFDNENFIKTFEQVQNSSNPFFSKIFDIYECDHELS